MSFLEQLAEQLRTAQTQAQGVEVSLADVQDADIPVLLGLGFSLGRDDNMFRLQPDQVQTVISKLEAQTHEEADASAETASTSAESEAATTEETSQAPPPAPSATVTESEASQEAASVALSDDVSARILALEAALEAATNQTRQVVRQRREDTMNHTLTAAVERGVPAGVINVSRTMLNSLLDVQETPALLSLSDNGATKQLDVFDSLIHLLSAIPSLVPTEREGDSGKVLSPEQAEDQQIIEAAAQIMAQ